MHPVEDKATAARSARAKNLRGCIRVPGDKSISHRALMLGSQALGHLEIHGLLEGEDVLRTAEALRQCGVRIERTGDGVWHVDGVGIGGLHEPSDVLDMGNAGTAARLLMGLLAPYPFTCHFTGDISLRKRPMQRVIAPLEKIGAQFWARAGGRLPLAMKGTAMPLPTVYELPVASAQVKSAVLLAGLNIAGTTTVIERERTRDHTERMLRFFGVDVQQEGNSITVTGQPQQHVQARTLHVPADPSSTAFPLVAALLVPDSEVTVTGVCLNPLRTGLFDVLQRMGAHLNISNEHEVGGEPVGDITARTSQLHAVDVEAAIAPSMIDEYPILAIAAACATGKSIMRGLGELRVKESDRLAAVIAGLTACGVDAYADGDDLIVHGVSNVPTGGATVTTHFDHRIAMSFLVLGLVTAQPVTVDDTRAITTSFPGFVSMMVGLGANIQTCHGKRMLIAVDGPAASGKGTLARRLADHYGIGYLDTGSLYRAVAMRMLYANKSPSDVAAAIAAARAVSPQDLANPKLRGERIGQAASIVSAIPEVRDALFEYQRHFAASQAGAVLDGRDIGTIICPEAEFKIFITASLEARAQRRHRQLQDYGVLVDYQSVYNDLATRDARDAARSIAPLKPADDAVIVDTSTMSANEVYEHCLGLVTARSS